MKFLSLSKIKNKGAIVYPLIIIVTIPVLLVANTLWNLRSFNRDVNFVIRHQAVGIADTIKPIISPRVDDSNFVDTTIQGVVSSNGDILESSLVVKRGKDFVISNSTDSQKELSATGGVSLHELASSFNEPFAGLSYDSLYQQKAWTVIVPLEIEGEDEYFLEVKLSTESVDRVLTRTSRDSIIVLSVLIVIVLILLANHFIFYKKAIKANHLQEVDKLKDEFISMAAHELKAPITAVLGYVQILEDRIETGRLDNAQKDLEIIERLSEELRDLISDLLDVSRIEQGRFKLTIQQINMNDLLTDVIKKMTPVAQNKGLALNFNPVDLAQISSDPARLKQIFTNLISNSIKYTLKGNITIDTKEEGGQMSIRIADTGIGIPPDHVQKLFTKFHRVKDKQTEEVKGTGLGLWITKQIIEKLGGKIYVESIYGTGTVTTITLPVSSTVKTSA